MDYFSAENFLDSFLFTLLAIDTGSTFFLVILLFILLLLTSIISGAEIALFSLQSKDVNVLKTKQQASAKRIVSLLNERKAVYTSLLIASTFFNISIIVLANFLLTPYLNFGTRDFLITFNLDLLFKVVFIAITLVLVVKILPKVWATHNNLRFAYSTSGIVDGVHLLLRRISLWMVAIADNINEKSGSSESQTFREIDRAINVSAQKTSTEEKNILKGIAKFGEISVKQIMRFRLDVNGLEFNTSFSDVVKKVEELHYSRLPVFKTNLDDIVGILNTKDLLPYLHEKDFNWHSLVRPSLFVPESKLIKDLLREFQKKRVHFAVVVDEFGGTSGIVTMEDILEEIVGEIRDEFDEDENVIRKAEDNSYTVDAKIMLHDMCRAMSLALDTFDEVRGESDSLGGLVLELAGEFPKENDIIRSGDFEFTVLDIDKNRINSVKVIINNYNNED